MIFIQWQPPSTSFCLVCLMFFCAKVFVSRIEARAVLYHPLLILTSTDYPSNYKRDERSVCRGLLRIVNHSSHEVVLEGQDLSLLLLGTMPGNQLGGPKNRGYCWSALLVQPLFRMTGIQGYEICSPHYTFLRVL